MRSLNKKAGQRATSLTLKHVVQQSSAGDRSIGRAARVELLQVLRQLAFACLARDYEVAHPCHFPFR